MPSVVADTSPIFYLLMLGHVDVLQKLFGAVCVPTAVSQELRHPAAPAGVRNGAGQPPEWVVVKALQFRGVGERSAIALALSLPTNLVLMDDRKGAAAALRKGLEVTGTLGIVALAARRGLVDLGECFTRLKQTNFRYRPEIMDALLAREKAD